ncbi:IS66 family insertion sequence element accessory protein TnpA [Paenibacillus sabuli]|uniref:IS66 family insertion sequence element accessory protein TnpA n=1 Tax=Paenibacillus sabuli TaxID=2772509 RepID=UPI0037C86A3D
MSSREQRARVWVARLAEYHASGQTMKAWCAAHAVSIDQLKYWKRKHKDSQVEGSSAPSLPRLLPVALTEDSPLPSPEPLSLYIGSVRLEVRSGFDPQLLRATVAALQSC